MVIGFPTTFVLFASTCRWLNGWASGTVRMLLSWGSARQTCNSKHVLRHVASKMSSTYTERCKGIRIKSTAKAKQVNLIIQTINAMITIPTYDHADDIDAIHDDRMPDAE